MTREEMETLAAELNAVMAPPHLPEGFFEAEAYGDADRFALLNIRIGEPGYYCRARWKAHLRRAKRRWSPVEH